MLRKLHAKGLISAKVINYIEMANKVKQLIRSGMNKTQAVKKVAEQARTSTRTVFTACSLLK